jgi:activating signal cointegrator 1
MKAITLYQPYASALFLRLPDGQRLKAIETRSWATKHRGTLAIHAAKTFPKWAKDFAMAERTLGRIPERLSFGCIIGIVTILAMRRVDRCELVPIEKLYGDYSPGRWGWLTCDPILFKDPIPWKGQQGTFNVPDEIIKEALKI